MTVVSTFGNRLKSLATLLGHAEKVGQYLSKSAELDWANVAELLARSPRRNGRYEMHLRLAPLA